MPAKLLTGKEVAQKMDLDIQKDVQELKAKGVNPALRIMIVGDAADSVSYANSAKKMAEKNGIACEHRTAARLNEPGRVREYPERAERGQEASTGSS